MNRIRRVVLCCCFAPAGIALAQVQGFPLAVPLSAAASEGSSSTAIPFGSSLARHVMYAYGGSATGFAAPIRIAAILLRADGATPGGAVAGSYDFTLDCSTAVHPATALSTTFASNHGADRVRVRSGVLRVQPPAVGLSPNPFSLRIPFATPFEWDPRRGPLLLDFACNAAAPAFGAFDAETAPNDVGGIAANGSATAVATSVLTAAPVLQLLAAADAGPAAFAAAEATSSTSFPWNRPIGATMRTLNLYEPAALSFTGRRLVTALAWRTDTGQAFGGRSYDVRISLSTSGKTASSLDPVFAANHGADLTVVFDGAMVCAPTPASVDLSQFDVFCELQRPFEYDPANGALAVDVQLRGSTGATGPGFDCSLQTGLPVGRLSDTTSATATTASSIQAGIALVMAIRSVPVPVLPASLANAVNPATGNGTSFPWGASPCRTLAMVSAAAAGITQPTFVRHLRFRPSGAGNFGPSTYTCSIDLSNPTNTPATLSPTYDLDHGSNRRRVFDGRFSVPLFSRGATDPRLPIEVELQQPFLWDPLAHPYLSVDIVVTDRTGPGIQLETTASRGIDNARLTASSATAVTGTPQQIACVMQIGGETANGLAVNYGAGCPGTNGPPLCTTVGLPSLPNRDFRIRLHAGAGNALALLLVGFHQASFPLAGAPGCSLLHTLELGTFGIVVTDPGGDGSLAFPLGKDPAFDGFPFCTQWLVLDAAANALGLATSDAQLLTMKFF